MAAVDRAVIKTNAVRGRDGERLGMREWLGASVERLAGNENEYDALVVQPRVVVNRRTGGVRPNVQTINRKRRVQTMQNDLRWGGLAPNHNRTPLWQRPHAQPPA
eukprot:9027828-Lingulodinium_polyedra.AAC.1